MDKLISIIFGTSIKTTLVGYLGAAASGIIPVLQTGKFEPQDLILPATIAIVSRFAKDADKTGAGK